MTHLQRHSEYGRRAVHDPAMETLLSELSSSHGTTLSFIATIQEIARRNEESLSQKVLLDLQLDFNALPPDPSDFFHALLHIAQTAPNSAAACLDTSSILGVEYNSATGGIKEIDRPYEAAFFIDRFHSRIEELQSREETPFAVLRALSAGPQIFDRNRFVSRYEIFHGPQENDGRLQSPSIPDQVVGRGILLCFVLAEKRDMTVQQQHLRDQWVSRLSDEITAQTVNSVLAEYRHAASTMNAAEKVNSLMCTLAGRNFIVERPDGAIACYYWDPEYLTKVRHQMKKLSQDINGPKLYGSYWRIGLAWTLVASGSLLAIMSGVFNWAKRENDFERVNDVFSTFLLVLSLPAFTVKIAATNGDQAIKDWLTGVMRVKSVEHLETHIARRLKGNKRRAWVAMQRVKCETDDRQNWTAKDNMCFKTGHMDGSLRAEKDRNMSELEFVIGTNGNRARSWIQISNETNIIGSDVNHLQFTCGTTNPTRTPAFFSQTPSPRVWFA